MLTDISAPDDALTKDPLADMHRLTASRPFALAFLILIGGATLFPPFYWGEELLQTETERRFTRVRHPQMYDQLPIKSHAFLLGDSKKEFIEWGWDGQHSAPVPVVLHRRLVSSELWLEYLIVVVLSAVTAIALARSSGRV